MIRTPTTGHPTPVPRRDLTARAELAQLVALVGNLDHPQKSYVLGGLIARACQNEEHARVFLEVLRPMLAVIADKPEVLGR
jgi:hypothetical protein